MGASGMRKRESVNAADTEMAAYALRLPVTLKTRLEQAAAANGRSLNSEIVQRLKRSR